MAASAHEPGAVFEEVASAAIDLANDVSEREADADPWEVAAGLLTGAVQFWLFSHQPCDDPDCEDCAAISTSRLRLEMLLREVRELAEESDYFHSPHDSDIGRA
jgi:hypothetical protein